jgi:hypothetical protein
MSGRLGFLAAILALSGCNIVPSRVPLGESLPAGTAHTLEGQRIRFPDALAEGPTVLAIAYTDEASVDARRWIEAIGNGTPKTRAWLMRACPGTIGILLSPFIDEGERKHRPEADRTVTVTAYGDLADAIATQTGMGKAELARVLLVREDGVIAWFCDTGFADDRVADLLANLSDRGDSAGSR